MPDHLHILLVATSRRSDFRVFARRFKQLSGYHYSNRTGERLWQPGYYERILRDDEATEAVARYILENPLRAGLAHALGEYPFCGSTMCDWRVLAELWRSDGRT